MSEDASVSDLLFRYIHITNLEYIKRQNENEENKQKLLKVAEEKRKQAERRQRILQNERLQEEERRKREELDLTAQRLQNCKS